MIRQVKFNALDLVIAAISTLCFFLLSANLELAERWSELVTPWERFQIDEFTPTLIFFCCALIWLLTRQNKSLRDSVCAHTKTQQHLTEQRDHLDVIVTELSEAHKKLREESELRMQLQETEVRAQRLETAGTIAGQVAHDLNNLLGPIIAYPAIISNELPPDHEVQVYLSDIESAASKIASMNQELLTLGRRAHYAVELFDLNKVVKQAVREVQAKTETISVEMNLDDSLKQVSGGPAQVYRVLSNLLVNALDASSDNDTISVRTENYLANETSIAFGRVPKGDYVKLTVTDSGCGIPQDVIQQILDPFFTTKTANDRRGSGLGMSVVDSVMKDHNGYIDVNSVVNQGTSFYLYFPVSIEDTIAEEPSSDGRGTERVLIVDDDQMQREVSTQLLTNMGYAVSSVESGELAIDFVKETPQDIIILDMEMPDGIDGCETYRRILKINPLQKALLMSGFSQTGKIIKAQALGVGAFIRKPASMNTLAMAVRTELDREPTPELS